MLDPKTLRGRLGLGYALCLIVALAMFALIAVFVVDHAQREGQETQLQSIAGAVRIIGDVHDGKLSVDDKDRAQFRTIVGAKAQSAIVSPSGAVIVSTDDRMAQALAAIERDPNASSFSDADVDGEHVRLYSTPMRNDGKRIAEVLAWDDLDAIGALDRKVIVAFAIAIPIIALLAMLAGGEIARRGLVPLDRIASVASEIEGHDLSRRLDLPARPDELGTLAATFDRMLDRLQSAFDRERRFTSDASHELRAPLSVIRAEADLALRQERAPHEYQRALETIASEADALEALTRDLLAAARDGSTTEDVRAPVDLSVLARVVTSRVGVIAGKRVISVTDDVGSGATIEANRTLVERAIVCVVHNAIKYSPENGRIDLRLSNGGPSVVLCVTDDGPGFSDVALQRAFDRFWRDDDSRSAEGSGLGLSLAKTIVERYGGTIGVANAQPHGAMVRIAFPVGT